VAVVRRGLVDGLEEAERRAARWDAIVRSRRTLAWALLFDVVTALAVASLASLGTIEFTATWLKGLGLLLVKSAVTAAVSGVARIVLPPPE
jgi:hypothetical protein